MSWALGHLWLFSGRLVDGDRRLAAVLDASVAASDRMRADALTVASFLTIYRQHFDQGVVWADEAIKIYRSICDEQAVGHTVEGVTHRLPGSRSACLAAVRVEDAPGHVGDCSTVVLDEHLHAG
jgi:hypothetical protein